MPAESERSLECACVGVNCEGLRFEGLAVSVYYGVGVKVGVGVEVEVGLAAGAAVAVEVGLALVGLPAGGAALGVIDGVRVGMGVLVNVGMGTGGQVCS